MKRFAHRWLAGPLAIVLIIVAPVVFFVSEDVVPADDPWGKTPGERQHTDHRDLFAGPFENPLDVTKACLECHENAARQVVKTAHWTWESEPVELPGRAEPVRTGKKNLINNFCIGIAGNWEGCSACHVGYGWKDQSFDFGDETQVDCLVCHDQTGTYAKGKAGLPRQGVDLLEVARSVGSPTRRNCGGCHFRGGGGNAVKHGDLDDSLLNPTQNVDVHMGRHGFQCIDCHRTQEHRIQGRSISVSVDNANQIACTDCHAESVHADQRITSHLATVACQTCHIPQGAVKDATKMHWDWSTAGEDRPEDPHEYLKIKGSFVYERNFTPEYRWYNGVADRYLLGDRIDPERVTPMNEPRGDISDPRAKIWPFKIHRGRQVYDAENNYFLQPKTVGEGGYWKTFDWDRALRLGSELVGLEYSGKYAFAPTEMFWPITHMVVSGERALQCAQCHGENGRMDWRALGYYGDPMRWGGRAQQALVAK